MFARSVPLLLIVLAFGAEESLGIEEIGEFRHEARVMGKMGNHPNITQFITPFTDSLTLDVAFSQVLLDNPGVVNEENPLAVDQMEWVESAAQNMAAPPNSPGGVTSIEFEFYNLGKAPSLHAEGIVHRDIAARNFLVTTTGGESFASTPQQFMLFGNDGGPLLRGPGVGPVRWMAPESLILDSTNPQSDNYFELLAGSSFIVNYSVPEPSTVALVAVASVALVSLRFRRAFSLQRA